MLEAIGFWGLAQHFTRPGLSGTRGFGASNLRGRKLGNPKPIPGAVDYRTSVRVALNSQNDLHISESA